MLKPFQKLKTWITNHLVGFCIFMLIAGGIAIWWWLNRNPFTQNAFIVANIQTVTARVPGHITEVHVKNNQRVKKGDPLVTIYRVPYELRVDRLSAMLEAEIAKKAELETTILLNEAMLRKSQSDLENFIYLTKQANELIGPRAVSDRYREEQSAKMKGAQAQVEAEKQRIEVAKRRVIRADAEIKALRAELNTAKVDLELTIVRAECDGTITNMFITEGAYVKAGESLFALIDNSKWWIQSNFKETQLCMLKPGLEAEIWLWQHPNRVLKGHVSDVGWGVNRQRSHEDNGMPVVEKENEWFLLPQRFPVQIEIDQCPKDITLHPGASAFVRVKCKAYPLRNLFWLIFRWSNQG